MQLRVTVEQFRQNGRYEGSVVVVRCSGVVGERYRAWAVVVTEVLWRADKAGLHHHGLGRRVPPR